MAKTFLKYSCPGNIQNLMVAWMEYRNSSEHEAQRTFHSPNNASSSDQQYEREDEPTGRGTEHH
jgi:hypothetical protein